MMRYEDVEALRTRHAAWRLLRADNAALILGFLDRVFGEENTRSISASELAGSLDDEVYAINEQLGTPRFTKPARSYLDDWAAPTAGWLRKFYPPGSDEPHFDATPATERALAWLRSLRARSFVGTESRLNTLFDLLRQMVFGAERDPEVRLTELRRRRAELDRQIAQVEAGDVPVLDPTAQRDRYQQFATTARELLADFREVEANFRDLDRELRERVTGFDGAKGELLEEVLGDRDAIAGSDQGRSFQAFYDFLLSPSRQAEFSDLLERLDGIDAIVERDDRIRHIHYDWLEACERTQATVRLLSDQLRRFLDDRVWVESRRVMDVLRGIEARALRLRDDQPDLTFQIDTAAPAIVLPLERPLYSRAVTARVTSEIEVDGEDADPSALFDQVYVDRSRLAEEVRAALRHRSQTRLADLLDNRPLQHGLAELIAYLSLTDDDFEVLLDEQATERLSWVDDEGVTKMATLPRVTFARLWAADGPGTR